MKDMMMTLLGEKDEPMDTEEAVTREDVASGVKAFLAARDKGSDGVDEFMDLMELHRGYMMAEEE